MLVPNTLARGGELQVSLTYQCQDAACAAGAVDDL